MKTKTLICLLALIISLPLGLLACSSQEAKKKDFLFIANASFQISYGVISYAEPSKVNGNVAPTNNLEGGATQLDGPTHIVVSNDKLLFVTNFGNSAITIYENADSANGNLKPIRTVSGNKTKLANPGALFLDQKNDTLYVSGTASDSRIQVFTGATKATFDGDIAPTRKFGSSAITVGGISGLFLDGNDNLYVANASDILVFANASTLNGDNITPSRTLSGEFVALGLFIDTSDRLFVASGDALVTFAKASTLNGTVTPSTKVTGLLAAGDVVVDSGDRAYITQAWPTDYAVVSFDKASTISGAVQPTRIIKGDKTQLANPQGLFLIELAK